MADSGSVTRFDVVVRPSRDGVATVWIAGDLDAYTVSRLRAAMEELAHGVDAVFDLSDVLFIDSAGLGALIAAVRRVRQSGGQASVVSTRRNVVRLLRVTGFDRIAALHESIDAATA